MELEIRAITFKPNQASVALSTGIFAETKLINLSNPVENQSKIDSVMNNVQMHFPVYINREINYTITCNSESFNTPTPVKVQSKMNFKGNTSKQLTSKVDINL